MNFIFLSVRLTGFRFSEWFLALSGYLISSLGFLVIIRWPSPIDGTHLPKQQFVVRLLRQISTYHT